MTRREKIAVSILRPLNPSLIIILGAFTVVWGLWIANPWSTTFGAAEIYSAMASLLSEFVWGMIAVTSGAGIMYGAIKPSYLNLQIGSFIGFFHWFVIGLLFLLSKLADPTGIMALTFAVYSAIVWVNIKVNREHYESLL